MTDATIAAPQSEADARPAWGAVISMTFGVFGLVGAEFLPASLLTPMAADLRISEGMAGQAVTATAAVALATSLLVTVVTRRIDRRLVLLGLSVLLIFSNLLVAMASNLAMLLAGRVLLGMALGGFWTLSAATMMRLVPEAYVPKALSVMFLGVSAATVFAAPVGSYVGDIVGWRNVFLGAAVLGALALVVQFATLPSLPPRGHSRFGTLFEVLMRPGVGFAMFAILLVFTGHFAFFTYIRPFLETVTGLGVEGFSAVLLGFGIATFFGNYLGAVLLERSMRFTLTIMPVVMGALAFSLSVFGGSLAGDAAMVALWGLAFGAVPVAWSTWITRAVPDEAESAGGLFVAAINFAIATGAAAGGALFDTTGVTSVFVASGAVLLLAALTIVSAVRTRPA
ncbi:MFS transporter [Shinella granuli]|jgi:predicted MFS family arabinose efflux permease|uniref:Putative MFS family arabinose efflux permease n=2 Tax=Shinella granuli TaxID=323621 RepID=A0A4R2CH76_SHIGR|nr:MFS transporter [Shinella granuli]TCN38494.1 putative MFS family arabinose efflux permease [Shinella granuli]